MALERLKKLICNDGQVNDPEVMVGFGDYVKDMYSEELYIVADVGTKVEYDRNKIVYAILINLSNGIQRTWDRVEYQGGYSTAKVPLSAFGGSSQLEVVSRNIGE